MENEKVKIEGKFLSVKDLYNEEREEFSTLTSFLTSFLSEDPYYEVQTSGSTGKPAVIQLKKEYMRASARKTLQFLKVKEGAKILLCISPRHIGGIMMLVRWLEGKLDLYPQLPNSAPLEKLKTRMDFAAMVPLQLSHSIEHLDKVKKIIIGGGPVSGELERQLIQSEGDFWHTYGMTETISHVALRRIGDISDSNRQIFRALPGVDFSQDDRQCLVINAPEIGVKGLVTNDMVNLLSPETFIWKGRIDNVVNSGGIKIFPEEVERELGEIGFPYFLAGIPDKELGQKLVMIVESEEDTDWERLNLHFRKLNKYHRPRQILRISQFSYTSTGKIRRKATIAMAKAT